MSERAVPRVTSREEFVEALIGFINGPLFARHGARSTPRLLDSTTPLFETGIIDSLGILDLLFFVETATGHPVPFRHVDTASFGTIERISRCFWRDAPGGHS
jgi:hypothetical protein